MKISGYRDSYYAFSTKASEIARQLAFAGIALIWILRTGAGTDADAVIPEKLLIPAMIFVVALAMDLLHAAYGTLAWGMFSRFHEKRSNGRDIHVLAPECLNWPSLALFWSKILLVIVGYALVFDYLVRLMASRN